MPSMAGGSTTVIVNKTNKAMHMKVGNHRSFVHFTSVAKGAQHTMHVDYNDTYQEFLLGVDDSGKKHIVTSDDCCDFKCITITETDGHFKVHKKPRTRQDKPVMPDVRRPVKRLKVSRVSNRVPVKKLGLFTWGLMCR